MEIAAHVLLVVQSEAHAQPVHSLGSASGSSGEMLGEKYILMNENPNGRKMPGTNQTCCAPNQIRTILADQIVGIMINTVHTQVNLDLEFTEGTSVCGPEVSRLGVDTDDAWESTEDKSS